MSILGLTSRRYVPHRVFSSCISQCHERHRAIARKAKNKLTRKRVLMDETSFQPHGALLLPPYFPLLSSTSHLLRPRRVVRSSVYARITLITSTYSLRATSNHRASKVYALLHPMQSGERERERGRWKNTRNKRLTSFGCEMGIPRTVIEPCRECNGKPPGNGIPRESREKPHGYRSKTHRRNPYAPV